MGEPADFARSERGEARTVAVLGLGLIGGSLARDLAALGHTVLAHDQDPSALQGALSAGCVEAGLGNGAGDPFARIGEADVVVLALPVGAAPRTLAQLAPRLRATLVTDVGSTKRKIVAAAEAAGIGDRFVGSHPLAGDHRSGWTAARAGPFSGAPVFLSPARGAGREALGTALGLWRSVGADPEVVEAPVHDQRMAWLSHLPQAAQSALGLALSESEESPAALGPGGRDATRLAASPPALWADILLDNADNVEPALAALERAVARLRGALARGDGDEVEDLLSAAKEWKERSRDGTRG